jgi:hypothetical protein
MTQITPNFKKIMYEIHKFLTLILELNTTKSINFLNQFT